QDQDVVPYSLELEPGSLFLANSAQSLTHIAKLLKKSKHKHIGFNLDLSHFCLAGILKRNKHDGSFQLSSEITNSNAFDIFRTRIVHAHISDSSDKGHLGDLPFESIHDANYFEQQIQFLSNLISKENHSIPFSNYLSMELEAVGSWQEIERSFKTLCALCKSV
ncbi:hypothetical protein, partial [uncultured Gimesia sp.]|uniref:hypothetical protein n=1 Tax=uncultured Gimesia sp. TaxID=1678688 RepID=UPI00262C3971